MKNVLTGPGAGRARAGALYMAASAINFESEHTHIHQVLAVRNGSDGTCEMPRRPDWGPISSVG